MHRSGHEFPVELVVSPARIDNEWVFFAFIHDITAEAGRRGAGPVLHTRIGYGLRVGF